MYGEAECLANQQRMSALASAMELVRGAGLGDTIRMPKSQFVREHKKLVGILKKGTRKQQLAEASEQSAELKKELKGGAYRIRKEGDVYQVMLDGEVIATAPTERAAMEIVFERQRRDRMTRQMGRQLTRAEDQGPDAEVAEAFSPFEVVPAGNSGRWAIQNTETGEVVRSGFRTEEEARAALRLLLPLREGRNPVGRRLQFTGEGVGPSRVAPQPQPTEPRTRPQPTEPRTRRESDAVGAVVREARAELEERVYQLFLPHLRTQKDKDGFRVMIRNSSNKVLRSMLPVGGNQKAGFIRRMMAEVKKKHGGEPYGDEDADASYRNPTRPLAPDTTMKAPVAFDYFSMPKESRAMSKHIMDHFFKIRPYKAGEREELNEYELKKLRDAEAERQRRSRLRRKGGSKESGFVQRMIAEGKMEKVENVKTPSKNLAARMEQFKSVDTRKKTEDNYRHFESLVKDYFRRKVEDLDEKRARRLLIDKLRELEERDGFKPHSVAHYTKTHTDKDLIDGVWLMAGKEVIERNSDVERYEDIRWSLTGGMERNPEEIRAALRKALRRLRQLLNEKRDLVEAGATLETSENLREVENDITATRNAIESYRVDLAQH